MNRKLISLFLCVLCCWNCAVYSSQDDIDSDSFDSVTEEENVFDQEYRATCERIRKEQEDIKTQATSTAVQFLQMKVRHKIEKAQLRLELFTKRLNGEDGSDSSDSDDKSYWQKRIDSTKKKIQGYNDLLLMIELWKSRLVN